MKKMILTIFIILFFPNIIFAYSKYVIPGGESIGININSDGLIVVGYYKVDGNYINKNINISDRIIKVNNNSISSINDFVSEVDKSNSNTIKITIIRNNKEINTSMILVENKNTLKTGLYVKDNVIGLGTLTYIDPISKIYGSLGHSIILNETGKEIEIKDGSIFDSLITKISKSRDGHVGTKKANINFDKEIGSINKNTINGIYGFYNDKLPIKDTILIADFDDIKKGSAYILTVTKDRKINKYEINILDKYNNRKNTQKAFSFEVIDKDLINISGGIVQGMSGSPIIQDDMLIGAVTNVVIDKVTYGYGISIVTMLEEGDKLRN